MTKLFWSSAPDLQLQLWLGHFVASTHAIPHAFGREAFAVAGSPWHPDTWLASLCAWLLFHSYGFGGLTVASTALAIGALILVGLRGVQRGLPVTYNAFSIVLAACCMAGALYVGIDPLSWFFFALFLLLFEAPSFRVCALAPIAVLVWAQFDGRALFGPIVAVSALLGFAISRGVKPNEILDRAKLPAACVVATFLTPLGINTPLHAAAILHLDSLLPWSNRIAPWDLPNHAFLYGTFALVIIAGCCGMRRNLRLADALPFSATLVLALADGRNAAFFGICAAPMVFDSIAQYRRVISIARMGDAPSKTKAAVALSVALLSIGVAHSQRNRPELPGASTALTAHISSDHRVHRVYCETLQSCDVITASGNPRLHVFMDGRDAAFPLSVRKQQQDIRALENGWQKTLAHHKIDVVIAERESGLASMLVLLGDQWTQVPGYGTHLIFERTAGGGR